MKGSHAYASMPIDALYRWFAGEADPTSPVWGALCRWIAGDEALCARLDALPGGKRQPNLFLAALRYHGAPTLEGGPAFAAWVDAHWDALRATILARFTQTNEPGRCAVLAPILASLPQPIALLEVGASAGLCLIPDRYRYRQPWGDVIATGATVAPASCRPAGRSGLVLDCAMTGRPPGNPADLVIAHRAGLDAHPLAAADPGDARWLRALVWPGEHAREARLATALQIAASDPPPVRTGRLPEDLDAFLAEGLAAAEAAGATPVLMHSATLAYLPRDERDAVVETIGASGVRWLSFEGPSVVTSLRGRLPDDPRPHFIAALDGEPVARCSPHGGWADWLDGVPVGAPDPR
ncbi:MAG: DUF2332 domain-containing protein [Propioniciclava sp.]|uniref:DUF2332 domain-containing protein n=1 Tax=Propioniciclava sp. TaxID=2038686 RepID=UPI0039E3C99D